MDALAELWEHLFSTAKPTDAWIVIATGVVAVVVVMVSGSWRLARNVVTIAHEGGHAMIAILTGRSLHGIRLHADTSGLTYTRGSRGGPSAILTLLAGYLTPAVIGLLSAWLIWMGNIVLLLWIMIVLLVAMAVFIRNLYGVFSIVVVGFAIFAIAWWANPEIQSTLAYAGAWFLLIGSVRPVWEVWRQRTRGQQRNSDPDQLAELTHVPATLWLILFALFNIGAMALGFQLLFPPGLDW
ncbi:MAG: M50 family metallopeptidase [Stackebrandtia sp.]